MSGVGGITLDGALTLTGGAITLNDAAVGAANLTITADTLTFSGGIVLGGGGIIDLRSRQGAITGVVVLRAPTVRLRQVAAFGAAEPFNFSTTGSLELTTDAAQDVHDWMILTDRNLTVTSALNVIVRSAIVSGARNLGAGNITLRSTGRVVRIFENITTTGNITLNGADGINFNGGAAKTLSGGVVTLIGDAQSNQDLTLNASTVRITQDAAFDATGPGTMLMFGTAPGSLELTTDAAQVVYDWMIASGRNLTVTSAANVIVRSAIDLGTGALTLTSTGAVVRILAGISTTGDLTLNGAAGINFNGGAAKTFSGAIVTLIGDAQSNRALTITASDILRLSDNIETGTNNLSLTGATIQIGRRGADTHIVLRGGDITLTAVNGIQIGRFTGGGDFMVNNRVASFTVNAQGTSTIAGNITVDSTAADGGGILLIGRSGTPIVFTGARTITGRNIRLRDAATGAADLTLTASGTLMIENDITLTGNNLTLALSGAGTIGNGGTVRTLAASTVSLAQNAAFGTRRPFRFSAGSLLELTTEAAQDVQSWMIVPDNDLTVTSALNVIVRSAIGAGERGRDLGTGDLTLMSTGAVVRILAGISTMGDLTLSGVTGGINLNGGARILNGAIITLTGNAQNNNNALTITASGVLTINNNINIGTGALSLTASANPTFGSAVSDLSAGDFNFSPPLTCDGSTTPTCTDTTP